MTQKLSTIGKKISFRVMRGYGGKSKGFFSGNSGSLFKIGFFFIAFVLVVVVVATVFPDVIKIINDGLGFLNHLFGGA
ncbi:MAG: hypothetical protein ABSB71_09600 [Candidatus Bathyarchaeia archaeon]|jgi:hypothetical protein